MRVTARIEYDGTRRVESADLEISDSSISIMRLKREIMIQENISVPVDVTALFAHDRELGNDEIISGREGGTVFVSMRIPMPHVVFDFIHPRGRVEGGVVYMNGDSATAADIAKELQLRYRGQLSSENIVVVLSLDSDGGQPLPSEYIFRREAMVVKARFTTDEVPLVHLPKAAVDVQRAGEASSPMNDPAVIVLKRLRYECKWEEEFFEIPGDIANLFFMVPHKIVLHRRAAIDELYNQLVTLNRALVRGPPGCGKSTSMFAFALSIASQGKNILWICADNKKFFMIRHSSIEELSIEGDPCHRVQHLLRREYAPFDHVFVDQCRLNQEKSSNYDHVLLEILIEKWILGETSRRLYVITSDGCNSFRRCGFKYKDFVDLKPWTLEEYLVVLRNPIALDGFARSLGLSDISPDEIVDKACLKFYYAGVSARFFFDYTIVEIERTIHLSFRQIGSSFTALFNGDIGTAPPQAINVLFHDEGFSPRFSSRYIIDMFIKWDKVCPETYRDMALKLGSNANRGGVGDLFELFAFSLLVRSRWDPIHDLQIARQMNCPYSFSDPLSHMIDMPIGWYKMTSQEPISLSRWYKPIKSQHAGYDGFYALGRPRTNSEELDELVIIFLQVTCGVSHEFNADHFSSAAMLISTRIKGFIPSPNKKRRQSSTQSIGLSPKGTRLCIEVLFAVPSGFAQHLSVRNVNRMTSLADLDERWSDPQWLITQVPHSGEFRRSHYFESNAQVAYE